MSVVRTQIRKGAYYDSVALMQLQKTLAALPGVLDAGVVMGTEANRELLQQSSLLTPEAQQTRAEDLVIAIRAKDEATAQAALARVEENLTRRRAAVDEEYRPKSLEAAVQMLPNAQWVLVSVPGRYAAGVARDALNLGRHVFLYSDNVPIEDEIALKQTAREKSLLVMGPDCGTAIINGVGLGFANRVRRGRIGIVGASGTGIQTVSVDIHRLGEGISHAIGTGTHDLSNAVGAIATRQGLDLLSRDPGTQVIVLISKPPSASVAAMVLDAARDCAKPVVVDFIGYMPAAGRDGNLYFAWTLDDAAGMAVRMMDHRRGAPPTSLALPRMTGEGMGGGTPSASLLFKPGQYYLRGLYSGGTLAYEAQLILREYVGNVYSNAPLDPAFRLQSPNASQGHTIVDLGADEFMVGRLHPMIDNDLRMRRLRQEADDPEVAVLLLDVVLGYGAHPDPASELAPAIFDVRTRAEKAGRTLEVVAVVIGTDEDPQKYASQVERLRDAGAHIEPSHEAAVRYVGEMLGGRDDAEKGSSLRGAIQSEAKDATKQSRFRNDAVIASVAPLPRNDNQSSVSPRLRVSVSDDEKVSPPQLDSTAFDKSFAAINVGLESFLESLKQQNASAIQVDWRPPAGGNEKLMAILEKLKTKS